MASVATFYAQIGAQLKGLLWKDDGPVIGIQLENEYAARGPLQGEHHILALKKLAINNGLDVPLYTVTGWDNAVVPHGEVLSVFGGYPDAPWDASVTDLPPNDVYMFRFQGRVAGYMETAAGSRKSAQSDTPFLTAELGGGVQDTYHRRPVIESDDVAAIVPVMLGSGANLYGYYMFQGGSKPRRTFDLSPGIASDRLSHRRSCEVLRFPGSSGAVRPRAHLVPKAQSLPLFSERLWKRVGADVGPRTRQDAAKSSRFQCRSCFCAQRWSAGILLVREQLRSRGSDARAKQHAVSDPAAAVRAANTGETDRHPLGCRLHLAVQSEARDSTLKYSTAQLFTRITTDDVDTYFFEEIPDIPAEFVIKNDP